MSLNSRRRDKEGKKKKKKKSCWRWRALKINRWRSDSFFGVWIFDGEKLFFCGNKKHVEQLGETQQLQ